LLQNVHRIGGERAGAGAASVTVKGDEGWFIVWVVVISESVSLDGVEQFSFSF
jgi:hypothetical protein